ncbi:MAG: FGGY family carbohydrate kinase [Brevefilum sp.]|nr:FGGY family carbohydrate kinase [Brevefilum sp.]
MKRRNDMAKYLAGVDVGTTGARCALIDLKGNIISSEYREYGSTYPKPGWVEQNLDEMIAMTMEACKATIAKSGIDPNDIASIGFSTQRSVTVPVYEDGSKVRPMIGWQDARTAAEVDDMLKLIDAGKYYDITGMPMGTTWIVTKVLWMRKNEPELYKKTYKFVQNQDAVLKAFGADDFYTDISDMAFYGVWDVGNLTWSKELCDLFDVTPEMFGKPTPPGTQVAEVSASISEKTGFAIGTPICVGAGDQNCGVIGMGSIKNGIVTVTLGTAGLVILSLDSRIPGFGGMMITNHAVSGMWEMEGLSNAAASSYRWFRDVIGTQEKELEKSTGREAYEYLNDLAAQAVPGSKGLLYLPYLGTAATPRWDAKARSAFVGMSFSHGRPEMVRAVLEGVVLEVRDMMDGWFKAGVEIETLRLGGGATKSPMWNQIQADVYGRPVEILKTSETTVLGAAILGGVGAGLFSSIAEGVDEMVEVIGRVEPIMANHKVYEEMYQAYVKAYEGLSSSGAFDQLAIIQQAD